MTAAKEKVMGVEMAQVDRNSLDAGLDQLGLSKGGSNADKVKRLVAHFEDTPKSKLLECSVCGGDSTEDFAACPFCGAEDEEPVSEKKPKTPAPRTSKPRNSTKGTPVEAELVPDSKYTLRDLNASVTEIKAKQKQAGFAMYELGIAIRKNYEEELWRLRKGDDGEPAYRSFKQFCVQELEMSHTHAFNCMDISATFDKKQVQQIGVTKLGLVLKAPEKQRDKMLQKAQDGASKRELEEQLAKIRKRQADTPDPKPKKSRVTIAVAQKRKTIALFKRPVNKDDIPKLAKKMSDQPWGEWAFDNDTKLMVRLTTNTEGAWQLICEVRRTASDE